MQQEKIKIRFSNLPYLLTDMEKKKWIIDSFTFRYKNVDYIVIFKLYKEKEKRPSCYAKAKVEFASNNEFCDFFKIEKGNANRDLFDDFSDKFAKFIPKEKVIIKNAEARRLIGSRAEGNNPNAIFCFDVRRNGKKEDGTLNERSIENSNKAQSLRFALYEKYCADTNLSFFFSDDQNEEKTDKEIIKNFANR